jgi:hypothetical protein
MIPGTICFEQTGDVGSGPWRLMVDGIESAVDADALPAQSKAIVGAREPGKRSAIAMELQEG